MARVKKGWKLNCPVCGESEAEITLNLADLQTCKCEACGDEFAVTTAVKRLADQLATWMNLVKWIESAATVATPQPESE